ncbi:MAG: translocation/assembly module TamB [Bacteroidetes bacterium]|nr:MAG: translocation/assembly module TamB [Bacteroidota bacterium]
MQKATIHKYLKKLLKIIAWIVASFLLLFILIAVLLQFSSVQTFLIQKITSQVSQRVDTRVEIDRVAIRFPKSVGLKGIYLEDTKGDTLLYAGSIFVDVGMMGLFRNKVNVNSLELTDVVANMKREEPDTVFNYQFLIDAFSAEDTINWDSPPTYDESTEVEQDDQNEGWTVSIRKLSLKNIRYHNKDHFSGMDLQVQLDNLTADLRPADFLNEKFHAGDILISQPKIAIEMTPRSVPVEPDTIEKGMPVIDIAVAALILENPDFRLNSFDGTQMHINSGLLALHPEKISLHEYLISIKTLEADQLMADFIFPQRTKDDENRQMNDNTTEEAPPPFRFDFAEIMDWSIELNKLDITASSFSMKQGEPEKMQEFNPDHISLTGIDLHLADVRVSPNQLILAINNTSMTFSDAFSIKDLNMDVNLGTSSEINLQNLSTNQSHLSLSLNTPGSLLDFSQEHLTEYSYQLNIRESHIQQDLAWFVPVMNEYYFNWPGNKGIKMGARLEGKLADVRIDSLWLAGPDFFATQLSGQITGLPKMDSVYIDLPELSFFAVPGEFFANLPDTLRPQGFEFPEYINLKAHAKGSLDDFEAALDLQSNLGDFALAAYITEEEGRKEVFKGEFYTEAFDVGKLLQQTENLPEPLAFRLDINGNGLKPETMTLNATVEIDNLFYNDHSYNKIVFNAALIDSVASLQSVYHDSIVSYDLIASYGIFQQKPVLITNFELEYANLQALGLTEENLLVKTDLKTDLVFDADNFFNGNIQISNTAFAADGDIYNVPEIFVQAFSTQSNYEIALRSEFADIDYLGNFSPLKLGSVLNEHFAQYYITDESADDAAGENGAGGGAGEVAGVAAIEVADTINVPAEQFFNISIRLMPNELITEVLLRSLGQSDTLDVMVSYDSSLQAMHLEANWPKARYEDIGLDSLNITAVSNGGKMNFEILLDRISIGDIAINQFKTTGNLRQQNLGFGLGFRDIEGDPLYYLAGNLHFTDSLYTLQLDPEGLLLNAEEWTVPTENRIALGEKYIDIQRFVLESQGREISVNSREHELNYPIIDIGLRQIDLGRLTSFPGSDFPTLGGVFNGDISLRNIFEDPAFVANLSVSNFAFKGDTLGNIEISGENPSPDLYELMVSLQSELTDLVISGHYRTGDNKGIDIDAELARVDLPSFEGFTAGNLTHLDGFLSGRMKITGTTESPKVSGEIQMNETSFRVPAINAGYFVKGEKILFDNQQIRMQNLALEDSTGRRATLSGNINFADLNQIAFNLSLNSRNFLLMNVKPGQNELYNGRILMDSDLRLRGTQHNPTIEGRIKLNEGSNFTFTIPQTDPEAIGDEGVVEFIAFSDTLFFQLAQQTAESQPMRSSFDLLDVSVNIEIDRHTDVKIIIDEHAGDFLEVRGGGVLSFGIDPGGRISLSGRYEMVDGEYLLTFYDVIRRNFRIQSGSNIVWSGDPMNARVDITAIYTVRTNAGDLLAGQTSGQQSNSAAMRQQFPFLVYLKMDGNLEEPQISFELDLPPEHQNALDGSVMGRLNQINQNESELNKQVFALLIMGHFLQENPFASAGGGDISTTARSSASQILTSQLNKLSDRYIRGVDINFEVESFVGFEDEQRTGRTELQMEVSRNFFDERLRVTVGGNIELEDETRRQDNAADIAGDFSIEYLVTPDGNLILKGFRNKNYGDIFDGEVFDTGISLRFSRSYNRFRELFRKEEETTVTEEEQP